MNTLANYQLPPPQNWQDFESLCLDLWSHKWGDPDAKKNGRSGQAQHGVDISGRPQLGMNWAGVQCKGKDVYLNQTLTEKELLLEIEKAKTFRPPLSSWTLATTAPKNALIEQKAREITDEHLRKGLFSVNIWFWSDIVGDLGTYNDVARKHYPIFHSDAEQLDSIKRDTQEILANQQSNVVSAQPETACGNAPAVSSIEYQETILTTEYQSEIDYARDLNQKLKPKQAIDVLLALKNRIWHSASEKVRFRLLSNLGFAYYRLESFHDSANCFIEALQYNSHDENALANAALAYQSIGEHAIANKYIKQAIKKNPSNINANIILLNLPQYQESYRKALQSIPEFLRKNAGIAHNLGWIAFRNDDIEEAISWFEVAVENNDENNPEIKATLGQFLLPTSRRNYPLRDDKKSLEDYQRGLELLTAAWNQVAGTELEHLHANWILNRGVAKRLLGDLSGAISDIETALEIDPMRPEYIKHRALLAIKTQDFLLAISLLTKILDAEETPESAVMLADIYAGQGNLPEAINILKNFLSKNPVPELKADAAQMLLGIYIDANQIDDAKEVFIDNFNKSKNSIVARISEARLLNASGNTLKAIGLLRKAKKQIDAKTSFKDIVELGNGLYYLQQFEDAADCFLLIADPSKNSEQTRLLLRTYYRAGILSKALAICTNLREKFGLLEGIIGIEIAIHEEINDIEKARQLCKQYVETFPDDWEVKLRLAWFSYRLSDFQSVDSFLESAIDPAKIPLEFAPKIMRLLGARDRVRESIEIMYELRRIYYTEPEAHLFYAATFLDSEKGDRSWLDVDSVRVDTAVCLEELGERKEWYVIENRLDSDINRKELLPSHPLAKKMLGKRIGDKVVITSGKQSSERSGTISEIKSKYVHALHETMANYEKMFPDHGGLWQIYVGNPDNPEEFAEHSHKIFDSVSKQQEQTRLITEQYKNSFITIGAYAEFLGRSSYSVWIALMNNSEVGVVCSSGHPDEFKEAVSVLETFPNLAADVTSLHTMFEFDLGKKVTDLFGKILIAPGTIELIQTEILDLCNKRKTGYSTLAKREEGYVWTEFGPDYIVKSVEYLEGFLAWIKKYAVISPYLAGLDMPREIKEPLREALKREFFDTIFIVKDKNYVLFSEDGRLRRLAKTEFKVESSWFQPLVMFLKNKGVISQESYNETIFRLASYNIDFVSINAPIMKFAARRCSWFPGESFTRIIKRLGIKGSDIDIACLVITEFLETMTRETIYLHRIELIIFSILEAMTLEHSADEVLPRLRYFISQRFLSFPNAINFFLNAIHKWEKARSIIPYKFFFKKD